MGSWKRDFVSGLIVLVPLGVLAFVLVWIFTRLIHLPLIDNLDLTVIGLSPSLSLFARLFVALLFLLTLILAVGYLMRTTAGGVFEQTVDDTINRIPGLRVVYNASKFAVETALSGNESLQQPVRVETWAGLHLTAFKTGNRTKDGKLVLFMPTAPNVTTGFVVEVDPSRVTEVDESVEDALTRLLSGGFAKTTPTAGETGLLRQGRIGDDTDERSESHERENVNSGQQGSNGDRAGVDD